MIATTARDRESLREGGRRLALHLQVLAAAVVPGITGRELETLARARVEKDGDTPAFLGHKEKQDRHPYPSALCLSVNEIFVHSPAAENNVVIKEGDVVSLDFGIWHKGLCTDAAVTVIAGAKHDSEDERLVQATYEALDAGIAQARVGNTTGDIGYAVQKVAEQYGFGYPKVLSGHGVGKKVHEEPHVPNFGAPGTGAPLTEGLVIAIEPMFARGSGEVEVAEDGHSYRTKDRSRAAHAEHTVIITKNGPEILSRV